RELPGLGESVGSPLVFHAIADLGPVHGTHQHRLLLFRGAMHESLDGLGTRLVKQQCQQGRGVEYQGLHLQRSDSNSLRSRARSFARSSKCSCTADFSPGFSLKMPRKELMYSLVTGWTTKRPSSSAKLSLVPSFRPYFRRRRAGMTTCPLDVI